MERKVGIKGENQNVLQFGFTVVISNKFATFAFTCKPFPRREYSDYQCLKVLHFLVK